MSCLSALQRPKRRPRADPRQAAFNFDGAGAICAPPSESVPAEVRAVRGAVAYHAGLSAEAQVASDYTTRGYRELAKRWRGRHGEIDLIFEGADGVIFVEVKRARTHDIAIERLRPKQVARLFAAAEEYLDGTLRPCRFDVALVDGVGRISVLENAFI